MAKKRKRTLTAERIESIKKLLLTLNIETENFEIYDLALTHKSYANENYSGLQDHNERLEFLGDSVLSISITNFLYKKFPNESEGYLTKLRSKIVSQKNLSKMAKKLNFGYYLLLSKGEHKSNGMSRESILGNTFEALLGAVFLDKGFQINNKLINELFINNIIDIIKNHKFKDYKSELQEYFMRKFNKIPTYVVENETGIEHKKVFFIKVMFNRKVYGKGTGKNKKEAAQLAAFNALKKLNLVQKT
ncbi:ribonuclease III [Candidatus Dependentiae bacterium]|nr:ribonuclease III [Candidatus Dependentiae bacterium]